jgi:tetratricopeptide (TPR) repeat protein
MSVKQITFVLTFGIAFVLLGDLSIAVAQELVSNDYKARRTFEAGRNAYAQGHYHEAATLFQQAFDLSGRPVLLVNAGNAWAKVDERVQAVSAYRHYLRLVPDSRDRAVLEARIKDLEMPTLSRPPAPSAEETPAKAEAQSPAQSSGLLAGRTWTWVSLAASAASGGAALGLWLSAKSSYNDLLGTCGTNRNGCDLGRINGVSGRLTATNVAIGISAVSLAAAVALWFVEGANEDKTPGDFNTLTAINAASGTLELKGRF